MPMIGSSTDDGAGGELRRAARPLGAHRLWRRLGWSTVAAGLAALLLVGLGFLWFIWRVPSDEIVLSRGADGIVALTGGASRIADAMELMAAGRGRRLLISGANRTTTLGEISRLNPDYARVV